MAGNIPEDLYNAKIQGLNNEVVATESQLKKLQEKHINNESTLELTKKKFLTASVAKKEFLERDDVIKRKVLGNVLWNLTIENKDLASYKLKDPYQRMAEVSKNCSFAELSG